MEEEVIIAGNEEREREREREKLNEVAKQYNMKMLTHKIKALAFEGKVNNKSIKNIIF
jgi:hypothetical protein